MKTHIEWNKSVVHPEFFWTSWMKEKKPCLFLLPVKCGTSVLFAQPRELIPLPVFIILSLPMQASGTADNTGKDINAPITTAKNRMEFKFSLAYNL